MSKVVLVLIVLSISAAETFIGTYECHKYDGTQHKNDWHYVTITYNEATNTYKWRNRAGKVWTLYPKDAKSLRVGTDCPYYVSGHHEAKFTEKGVYGPWNEFYERKDATEKPKPKPKSGCPSNLPVVKCFDDPCHNAVCSKYPSAICKANYCGGCNADFYVDDIKVNCNSHVECGDIECSSREYKYATCNIDMPSNHIISKVDLIEQYSQTDCRGTKNKFGVLDGNRIWVDKGCRGKFSFCHRQKKSGSRGGGGSKSRVSELKDSCHGGIRCGNKYGNDYEECPVSGDKRIASVSLIKDLSGNCSSPTNNYGISINDDKIWVRDFCYGCFKYENSDEPRGIKYNWFPSASDVPNQLVVSWGQDTAGRRGLTPEKNLSFYCEKRSYDIISLSFIELYPDVDGSAPLPRINLSKHCKKIFPGYDELMDCRHIGEEIKTCQEKGKKVTLAIKTGPFNSAIVARTFAWSVWMMFFGDGTSGLRPFGQVTFDGIDLSLADSNAHLVEFVQHLRKLMKKNTQQKYLITASIQDSSVDHLRSLPAGHALSVIPHEFDQLYLKLSDNSTHKIDREINIKPWFKYFSYSKKYHGKGPLIFLGLQDYPEEENYIPPKRLGEIQDILYRDDCGGIKLWDASFDIPEQGDRWRTAYSDYISGIIQKPRITVCGFGRDGLFGSNGPFRHGFDTKGIICIIVVALIVIVVAKVIHSKYIARNKVKTVDEEKKKQVDGSIEMVKVIDEKPYPVQDNFEKV